MNELPTEPVSFDYPFVVEDHTFYDEGQPHEGKSWRPGVRSEFVPPDDGQYVYDDMGKQIITIVGGYRPGRFPERVFYTRKWQAPNGKVFGKNRLLIKTVSAFKRLIRGYQYELIKAKKPRELPPQKAAQPKISVGDLPF